MLGLMQEWPLLCHKIIDHAARQHPNREIVSRSIEGPIVRTNYSEVAAAGAEGRSAAGARRLSGSATASRRWPGTRARHVEAWYGIMGIGAIYHTLNPRLFPEQIAWIMNHAEDKALFVDLTFMPLVEKIAPSGRSR